LCYNGAEYSACVLEIRRGENMRNVELLMDYIHDGIQEINAEGRIVFCNRATAVLDDINIEDVLGRYILDVYPSLTAESSTLMRVLKTGIPQINIEQTYTNYRGREITTINTTLPVLENDRVAGAIEISRNITDVKQLSERVLALQKQVHGKKPEIIAEDSARFRFDDIITVNSSMMRLKAKAAKAAQTDSPILVCGDTGTGKELLVQALHNASPRQRASFIAQNCAALPSTLLEGILFGTVKGGFTGATDRPGLFELADGGTLFLDEINSMPLELQAKLLRVLQEGNVRRVGDTRVRAVDVRVVAASNIDPEQAVQDGLLRRDLFYRLNTMQFYLPSLKERRDDIPTLTEFFIRKYNRKLYRNVQGISVEVAAMFQNYSWPGNVRELEHVIEGALNIIDGQIIGTGDLPWSMRRNRSIVEDTLVQEKETLEETMKYVEIQILKRAMAAHHGNVSQAAQKLGIPRQTLQYRLKKFKLDVLVKKQTD